MKKIACSLLVLILAGCGQNDDAQCRKIKNVNWANRDQAIEIYKNCIGNAVETDDAELVNISNAKLDSMLYLSYIYLTDQAHYDWNAAIQMLNVATASMMQKCQRARNNDESPERYDNYCFNQYNMFTEKYDLTPRPINTVDDAMFVYQMALPCVYMDMIRENEQALGLIDSWFGSTRDLDIPYVCEYNLSGKFLDFDNFFDDAAIEYLMSLNPYGYIQGTIRFGFRTSNYHDLIYMLTYPTHFFKSDNFSDLYVIRDTYDDEDDMGVVKIYATDIEQKIYANAHATRGYKKMLNTLEKYYVSKLKMSAPDAKKYAHLAAAQIILQYIYMQ